MPPKSREAVLGRNFLDDLRFWIETDPRTARRVLDIVDAVLRDPFVGIGKPEPLKHSTIGPNTWSRRLSQEHRLIYRVFDDRIHFAAARHHY